MFDFAHIVTIDVAFRSRRWEERAQDSAVISAADGVSGRVWRGPGEHFEGSSMCHRWIRSRRHLFCRRS